MNRYFVGVLHAVGIAVFTLSAGFLWRGTPNLESAVGLALIISVMTSGYLNRKNYGPLSPIVLAPPQKGRAQFILGLGTIVGPAKLITSGFPVEGVLPIFNALLLVGCIPLGGLSLLPILIIGDWARGRLEAE